MPSFASYVTAASVQMPLKPLWPLFLASHTPHASEWPPLLARALMTSSCDSLTEVMSARCAKPPASTQSKNGVAVAGCGTALAPAARSSLANFTASISRSSRAAWSWVGRLELHATYGWRIDLIGTNSAFKFALTLTKLSSSFAPPINATEFTMASSLIARSSNSRA